MKCTQCYFIKSGISAKIARNSPSFRYRSLRICAAEHANLDTSSAQNRLIIAAMAVEDHYPADCAFCKISAVYPASADGPVPNNPDPELLSPQCHLVLSTPHVLAFLDIMPMAPGHILLTTRQHYTKLGDLQPPPQIGRLWSRDTSRDTARALGEWLPVVSRALCAVTGIEDWNVVQNNGHRAAQVVPHIHFHLIPRYQEGRQDTMARRRGGNGRLDMEEMKSWKMFGRGTREDLDDDEAKVLAEQLRNALREELEGSSKAKL